MRVRIRWMNRKPAIGCDAGLEKFRRVLEAAWGTVRYRPALEAAGLHSLDDIRSVHSPEAVLPLLEPISREDYLSRMEEFHNPDVPESGPHPLEFPFEPVPRTAVLMPGFQSAGPVRVFARDWLKALERFQPEAIAAPVGVLRHLAATRDIHGSRLPALDHSLIVFTGPPDGDITEQDRDTFWRAFKVPIFEQFLGFDGRLIASECEAHQGMHVAPGRAIVECSPESSELLLTSLTDLRHPALRIAVGFSGKMEESVCECGRRGPRLAGLRLCAPELQEAAAFAAD